MYMLFNRVTILNLAAQKNGKEMGVARRPVSSHVLVRAKSERSDWSRLELKSRSESRCNVEKTAAL